MIETAFWMGNGMMFRDVLASLLCLIVLAGCGETQHPVRQETLAPPVDEPEETGDEVAAGPSGPVEDGPSLPPGHPPMSAMPPMAPARVEMKVTAPEGWKAVQPRSRMIQAEFALPKAENDEADGRLTVTVAGGSIEANVDRWRGQFEDLEEKPVEEIDVSGTKVTLVDFSGTYNGMMGAAAPRPGYRMLGAIIAMPDEMVFVKGYGPQATMAQYVEGFRTFVESLASSSKAK